jgi:hypothetical protein
MEELLKHRRGQGAGAPARLSSNAEIAEPPKAHRSRYLFVSWWAVMPALVFWATFAVLCARECTALPWVTFVVGPAISAVLGLTSAIAYWIWALRLPTDEKRRIRWLILSSVLWGPAVGLAGLAGSTMVFQVVATAWALIF